MKKIFVRGFPEFVDDAILAQAFSEIGTVVKAEVIRERKTGRSRGFGFVEMSTEEEARLAISEFDRGHIEANEIRVMEARPFSEGSKVHGRVHSDATDDVFKMIGYGEP